MNTSAAKAKGSALTTPAQQGMGELEHSLSDSPLPSCKIFPDMADLKETFEWLSKSEYQGVKGVAKFDSGVPGPTVGITVLTHGNEPAGLAPVWLASKEGGMFDQLTCGSVIVAIANIDAATEYFSKVEAATPEELAAFRSIDLNMNRLPADLASTDRSNAEIDRAKDLLPILAEFDAGLDIHSTDVESSPMLVGNSYMSPALQQSFPIEVVLVGIAETMKEKPLMQFYGDGRVPAAVIEAGSHQSNSSYETAIISTAGFLQNMGLLEKAGGISQSGEAAKIERSVYEVVDSIFWETGDENMLLVKPFRTFEVIHKGQLLAEDPTTGKQYFSPCDGHALFPFMNGRPNNMNEEGMFITLPVRGE
jgi:hypothetical protein